MNYGIVLDPVFAEHFNPPGHPERLERVTTLLEALPVWESFGSLKPFQAPDVDEKWLLRVHSEAHFARIRNTADREFTQLDPDTFACPASYRVARRAAGATVDLTSRLVWGEIDGGFVVVRPPGHHAESQRPMGFCLFNNVAVAAEYALSTPGIDRVVIIDFDVHHGNGTQEIFYDRPDVLYLSTHQYPFYPGTGSWTEIGKGEGKGYTVNFPVSAGAGNDLFVPLFEEVVTPILGRYDPDLILVSAGFDAHRDDPLGGMNMDEKGFEQIVRVINSVAETACSGKVLHVLEGGYNLDALSRCIQSAIRATLEPPDGFSAAPSESYRTYRDIATRVFGDIWRLS